MRRGHPRPAADARVRIRGRGRPNPYRHIYAVVSRIPKGRVASYGQVGELAGLPRHARLVGRALRELPVGSAVPWHRVVNAQGRISPRGDGLGEQIQAQLLRREGVRLVAGRISLARYRWEPPALLPGTRGPGDRKR
jgi:methylated-DNA-protein-cysteine methyltransferase-like protein